jgi:hypothetical protein
MHSLHNTTTRFLIALEELRLILTSISLAFMAPEISKATKLVRIVRRLFVAGLLARCLHWRGLCFVLNASREWITLRAILVAQ